MDRFEKFIVAVGLFGGFVLLAIATYYRWGLI